MKTTTNNTATNYNGMTHVIAYAAELLNNGATVESLNKYGHQLREIRKGCEYVCLCVSEFAKAAAIADDIKSNSENTATNYNELGPVMATACRWLEEHPRTVSAVIWLELAALVYGVFNYNFTVL